MSKYPQNVSRKAGRRGLGGAPGVSHGAGGVGRRGGAGMRVIAAAALIPVSLVLVVVSGLGGLAFVALGLLGSALFAVSLCCLVGRAKKRSARSLLVASLAYLPLLIIAFAIGVS